MREQKFTPGPWKVSSLSNYYESFVVTHTETDRVIAQIQSWHNFGRNFDCAQQNSFLISSAPDMAEAISTVIKSGRLTTAEQAICAAALAKAMGVSIEEVIASQSI